MSDPPTTIVYQPYTGESQLPYVASLVETELSEPYVIYTYRYFLHQWPQLSFLAYPDGQSEPVGCIVCKLDEHRGCERGYIAMLSVAKTWRKRGIARSLVQKAIDRMAEHGAEEVVLETEYDNAPALALYDSLGFMREKRLFRFYLNGKDAFRLVLPLAPSAWSDEEDALGRPRQPSPTSQDEHSGQDK